MCYSTRQKGPCRCDRGCRWKDHSRIPKWAPRNQELQRTSPGLTRQWETQPQQDEGFAHWGWLGGWRKVRAPGSPESTPPPPRAQPAGKQGQQAEHSRGLGASQSQEAKTPPPALPASTLAWRLHQTHGLQNCRVIDNTSSGSLGTAAAGNGHILKTLLRWEGVI